jgi:hypothetical protein
MKREFFAMRGLVPLKVELCVCVCVCERERERERAREKVVCVRGGKPPLRNLHALRNQKQKTKNASKKTAPPKIQERKKHSLRKNKHPPQKKLTFPPKTYIPPPKKHTVVYHGCGLIARN